MAVYLAWHGMASGGVEKKAGMLVLPYPGDVLVLGSTPYIHPPSRVGCVSLLLFWLRLERPGTCSDGERRTDVLREGVDAVLCSPAEPAERATANG